MISRLILGIIGVAIIAFAILPNHPSGVGLDSGSVGQILLTVCGGSVLLLAFMAARIRPKKLVKAYEQTAVIVLNTLLFFIAIEMLIIIMFNVQFITTGSQETPSGSDLALYTEEDREWHDQFGEEYETVQTSLEYSAYDLWQRNPFDGETINIREDGTRVTANTACDEADAYRIYMYGGSTLWGLGVADWMTIPSYLQDEINAAALDRPVCIVNQADLAMVNTQEMIRLIKQLQRGDVPDLVIFYDGVNDVIAANQQNEPGLHRTYSNFNAVFATGVSHPLVTLIRNSYTVRFIRALGGSAENDDEVATTTDEVPLSQQVVDLYLENLRIINALGAEYGFEVIFFWQPVMIVGDKPLTEQEETMAEAPPDELVQLFQETYAIVEETAPDIDNLYAITRVFDGVEDMLFIDYNHVSYVGNERIAQAMRDIVIETIENTE